MSKKVAVTVMVDPNVEVVIKPLAAKLATTVKATPAGAQPQGATTSGTVTAPGGTNVDVDGDVDTDF